MTRSLVKTDAVAVDDQTYPVRYFAVRNLRGLRRFSAEIFLGPDDHVILDDDSVTNLEIRAARMIRITLYSRTLARIA
jgi:hypothetical protein